MSIQPVLLWSDVFIWLLVIAVIACGLWSARQPPVRVAWARVARNRTGMAAATLLAVFALIGLTDRRYRTRRATANDPAGSRAAARTA